MRKFTIATNALFAIIVATALLTASPCRAQPALPGPDAKLCKKLPLADIEAAVGAKLASKRGTDGDKYNSCTAIFGTASAKIEHHQPGQGGLPPDVKTGLAGLTTVFGANFKNLETRNFGEIGCYHGTLSLAGQEAKSTVCFLPKGYDSISVGGLPDFVPMETVKSLLEKAVAASKAP